MKYDCILLYMESYRQHRPLARNYRGAATSMHDGLPIRDTRMKRIALLAVLAPWLAAGTARAEVRQAAADSFFLAYSEQVSAQPVKAYAAIVAVPAWWNGEHTWSGQAANLSLKAEAGGCFCERWPGGSAEHGRVLMALPGNLLRLETALGPLQELALKGILSFWIRTSDDGATRIDVEYRVNGAGTSGLDELAPKVDEVLGTQVARLKRYIDTGKPDEPPSESPPPDIAPSSDAIRAALLEQWKREAEAAKSAEAKPAPAKATKPKPSKRDPAPKP